MKIVYNSKEISNSTDNYNSLLNLPMINSSTLQGVKTLNDINAYSKQQVDELIGNSRAIEIVTALPTNLIENTLYYVGPDANDFYDVYLVDEVRNVINIGTSQFGEYFGGTGIDIDDDNYIHAKIDNKTIIVDSEGNLHADLDLDSVPVMTGATASVNGEKGLVPQPQIGDNTKFLRGDGTWAKAVDLVYPIGSVYLSISNSINPNNLFPGTTWVQLGNTSTGVAIWNGVNKSAVQTISQALPDFSGKITTYTYTGYTATGPHSISTSNPQAVADGGTYDRAWLRYDFNYANYGTNSTVFKDSQTVVQPPAVLICGWRRTA